MRISESGVLPRRSGKLDAVPLACDICGTPLVEHPMRSCRPVAESTFSREVLSPRGARRLREVALWAAGWPMTRIAAEVGISTRTVQRDLATRPTAIPAPSRVLTSNGHRFPARMPSAEGRALRRVQAVRLVVGEGLSVLAAARVIGWPPSTVRNDLIAVGVQRVGTLTASDGRQVPARMLTAYQLEERRARAHALRARGLTFAKIAVELGVSYSTAERDAASQGVREVSARHTDSRR